MAGILSSNVCTCLHGDPTYLHLYLHGRGTKKNRLDESFRYLNLLAPLSFHSGAITTTNQYPRKVGPGPLFSSVIDDPFDPDDESEAGKDGAGRIPDSNTDGDGEVNNDIDRQNLERMVGSNDTAFSGTDLATLIRKKYGRSYDVQFIKKEFMGRNLLALNVMWKYVEQRSFPLSEEEYLLRLDDVANTLKCWGAVSHVRNSLEKLKERPRIGKAVSIFIDMDETGGRANEWIYK